MTATFDADQAIERLYKEHYSEKLKERYRPDSDAKRVRRLSHKSADRLLKTDFRAEANRIVKEHPHLEEFVHRDKGHAYIIAGLAIEHLEPVPDHAEQFREDCHETTPAYLKAKVLGVIAAFERKRRKVTRRRVDK